ncbi:ARPP-1 family domain-containing protein [Diaminobutyricimonas sp. LJ205]|uniref:ARPP-1 family domain-containing protein n=1 Tax=Diaminobutyricimonas sp. LJ205 TaxID=2683590 RepID=UPI0012F4E28A|nr:DUF6569 family protein [Diaminobutyricimonas sp. LJ205]
MNQIPRLHVGTGTQVGALTVFPVWVDAPKITGLDWKAGSIRVAEREGSPVVGELVVQNTVPRPVVALEGDLLRGGWQDRMLARSMVLEPFEARVVDAFCVEAGRWHGAGDHTAQGRRSAPSVRHGNLAGGSQSAVWQRISRYDRELGATPSSSMLDHLDRNGSVQISRLEGQRGVIIGIGGRIVGAEIFGSSAGLGARWQGLLDAAALDAHLAPLIRTGAAQARAFVRHLGGMTLEHGEDAGIVRSIRSHRGSVRATGIGDGTRLIHLAAFDDEHPLLVGA